MSALRFLLQAIGAVCLGIWLSGALGVVDVLIWIGPVARSVGGAT